jgi:uncharacterized protein YjbI with pentapeptide repeats
MKTLPKDGSRKLLAVLREGAGEEADLRGVVLAGKTLREITLSSEINYCDFSDAIAPAVKIMALAAIRIKFVRANLRGARLKDIGLSLCDFTQADLSGAKLALSELHKVQFAGCNLSNADLSQSELYGADLSKAIIKATKFKGARYDVKTKWPGDPPSGAIFVEEPEI